VTRQQQIAVLFSALLLTQANGAQAAVTRNAAGVSAQDIQTTPYTDTFSPVFDVTALLGISGGTIHSGEGGTFTLSGHFTTSITTPLFSIHMTGNSTFLLNTIQAVSIDPANGPLDGLVYSFAFDPTSSVAQTNVATVEVTYSFQGQDTPSNGVPEPLSLSLIGTGLAGLAWARRRR